MNCEAFDNVASDLARGGLVDAALRQDGLEHSSECEQCAVRLLEERSLSNALGKLAASDMKVEAPSLLESKLLDAFRLASAEKKTILVGVDPTSRQRRYHWGVAAAAAIVTALLAIAGVRLVNWKSGGIEPVPNQGFATATSPTETTNPQVDPEHRTNPTKPVPPRSTGPNLVRRTSVNYRHPPSPQPGPVRSVTSLPVDNSDFVSQEIATDFFPVSYASSLSPLESGRVIRVELPRTALASYGLPMDMAQTNGRVKADVLMDDYGTARAIRFVK